MEYTFFFMVVFGVFGIWIMAFNAAMYKTKYKMYHIALRAIDEYNKKMREQAGIQRAIYTAYVLHDFNYVLEHNWFDWGMQCMFKQKQYYDILKPYFKKYKGEKI